MLPVENWMKDTQRFTATIEFTAENFEQVVEKEPDTFVTGAETLVVPPLHTRDYNLKFYAYKEGVTHLKVTFKNQQTGEFIFYNITGSLEAPVRQTATKVVTIQNPFGAEKVLTFPEDGAEGALPGGHGWWQCDNTDVQVVRLGDMTASQEVTFEVRYRPLVPSEGEADLSIFCVELGWYKYHLNLRSTAAGTERSLNFKAP